MLTFPDVPEMAKSLYCYWERNIYRLVQSPFGRVSYPVIGQLSRIFVSYWLERSHVLANFADCSSRSSRLYITQNCL